MRIVANITASRARASPLQSTVHKPAASRASRTKLELVLPSVAAWQPGWRQKMERQKQLYIDIPMEEDTPSEQNSRDDDTESPLGSDEGEDVWDSGLTLVDEGQAHDEQTEQERNEALIDSLKTPFEALSVEMKNNMMSSLAPAIDMIRDTNKEISLKDEARKMSMQSFEGAANALQTDAEERAMALKHVMLDSQTRLKKLLKELQAQYSARAQLRTDSAQSLDRSCKDMLSHLQALAENYDDEAIKFEAKGKKMVSKSKNAASAWQRLMAMDQ
ncbi:hypothetical protein DACRYDRAFT_20065 [Dacryopinax primogenitus]|uniref:Uncharacterized protein n=1 Tax=Dacryopinax primogenitus (strain DJM 731) TaxID=1858805 RepID=M5G5V2_DACPD|nr:uncharacterized protein DACRYDRAFT_20065 [Dacryopinax primogenitus]EJU05636.1 hypothetical protein DACRYDRAFT_20065 [Dacryopinax primogenitus]